MLVPSATQPARQVDFGESIKIPPESDKSFLIRTRDSFAPITKASLGRASTLRKLIKVKGDGRRFTSVNKISLTCGPSLYLHLTRKLYDDYWKETIMEDFSNSGTALAPCALSGFAAEAGEVLLAGEKIGVHCIKLVERQLGASAIVHSFFSVDKTLLGWSTQCHGTLTCEFEILYNDGKKLHGVYQFQRRGGRRPALMQFVRASQDSLSAGVLGRCSVFGLGGLASFLDAYETEDFSRE